MEARGVTPILNVSDMARSFAWFERLGWTKQWEWGDPPDFGAVNTGGGEIFLCLDGQGGRGEHAMWMSVWVEDVDVVHQHCVAQQIEITQPPTDFPWNVREMHVRHPDGHRFRFGTPIGVEEEVESFARRVRAQGPPLPIARVDVPVRLEARLAALLRDLAAHKGMDIGETLEETLLHTFEIMGGGVPSPHTPRTHRHILELKQKHGLDYDCHANYRFVETA